MSQPCEVWHWHLTDEDSAGGAGCDLPGPTAWRWWNWTCSQSSVLTLYFVSVGNGSQDQVLRAGMICGGENPGFVTGCS